MLKSLYQLYRDRLAKGGPGSGRYPLGSGKGKESEEKTELMAKPLPEGFKMSAKDTKYANNLADYATEIAYEHGDSIKGNGVNQVVSDWYVLGKVPVSFDDLENMTTGAHNFKTDNPKASIEDAKQFVIGEYRNQVAREETYAKEEKAKKDAEQEEWNTKRAEDVKANTPSKDEKFKQDINGVEYEESRETADGPTGGSASTALHFHTKADANEAHSYFKDKFTSEKVNHKDKFNDAYVRKPDDAKYYTLHINVGSGDDKVKEMTRLDEIVSHLNRKFNKK